MEQKTIIKRNIIDLSYAKSIFLAYYGELKRAEGRGSTKKLSGSHFELGELPKLDLPFQDQFFTLFCTCLTGRGRIWWRPRLEAPDFGSIHLRLASL